jgi:hypothetical protein
VLSFDPVNKSITKLSITGALQGKTLQQFLAIPVDGSIQLKKEMSLPHDAGGILTKLLSQLHSTERDITTIDMTHLFIFTRSINTTDIEYKELKTNTDQKEIDTLTNGLFTDADVVDDNKTIEIINATTVPGLGSRLERMLKNMGANVVAVSSPQKVEKQSKIYYLSNLSYTVDKIASQLGYRMQLTKDRGVADIKIVVGEDMAKNEVF